MKTAEETLVEVYGFETVKELEQYLSMVDISGSMITTAMHQFATQQLALAVAKRERQIGALLDQMLDEDHPKAFYKAVVQIREFLYPISAEVAQSAESDELEIYLEKEYLKTLNIKPSAEIAQVEPEKVSDNFRINIIPELSRGELEERCIEMYERLHNQVDSIPIREIEELRDLWQDRVNWISEEIPRLTTARLRVYAVTTRESMKGCIEEVNNIIQSKKK